SIWQFLSYYGQRFPQCHSDSEKQPSLRPYPSAHTRLCSDPSKRVWPAARFLLFVAQHHDKGMLPSDKRSSLRPAFLLEQVAGCVPPRPRLERLFPTIRVWRFPCRPEPCPSHAGPPVELPELLLLPRLQLEPRGLRPVRTHCGLRRSHRDQTGLGH